MDFAIKTIDSRSELCERLRQCQSSIILGDDDESTNEYFITSLSECLIGICSQGQGIQPFIQKDSSYGIAWVGFNSKLANLNIEECRINYIIELDSVFFSILCTMQDGSVIVIHELGATRISSSGGILWSVSTDILTGFQDNDKFITLITEEDIYRIDKEYGHSIKSLS